MTYAETLPETKNQVAPIQSGEEPLLDLQLLVARRADTLARRHLPVTRETDRRVWLRAEWEVFDRAEGARS